MRRLLTIALVGTLALSGCARPDAVGDEFPAGTTEHDVRVDGVERRYQVTVPENLQDGAPLVLMLHGGFGSAEQARQAYGWDELAASEGFVVAYPDGLGRAWNVGDGCCGTSGERGVDDVAFIEAVVDQLRIGIDVASDRVFATGMSNGAMLSYRLACDTDTFRAIGPVAGTILGPCDDPAPTSVIHIHGEADESVHLDGSPGTGAENIDGMPIPDIAALWREVDGCDEPVVTVDAEVTTSLAACRDDRAVDLITIAGAGHHWPGSVPGRAQERFGAGEPYPGLDATATIWAFFAAH